MTELCLPPYEIKAFALALGVSSQNRNSTKLARSGTVNFGLQNERTYLFNCVLIAWNAIYNSAAAVAGTAVNRLL